MPLLAPPVRTETPIAIMEPGDRTAEAIPVASAEPLQDYRAATTIPEVSLDATMGNEVQSEAAAASSELGKYISLGPFSAEEAQCYSDGTDDFYLPFDGGDHLSVFVHKESGGGWVYARIDQRADSAHSTNGCCLYGWVPENYLQPL